MLTQILHRAHIHSATSCGPGGSLAHKMLRYGYEHGGAFGVIKLIAIVYTLL